jgi:hypothetical protein
MQQRITATYHPGWEHHTASAQTQVQILVSSSPARPGFPALATCGSADLFQHREPRGPITNPQPNNSAHWLSHHPPMIHRRKLLLPTCSWAHFLAPTILSSRPLYCSNFVPFPLKSAVTPSKRVFLKKLMGGRGGLDKGPGRGV